MLLRICLIVALVAGLATAVVNFVYVQKAITSLITDRDQQKSEKETAQKDASDTHKKLDTTTKQLATTKNELASTKRDLESANDKATELDKKATDLTTQLTTAKGQRDKAEQELSQWNQLRLSPQDVVKMTADLKSTTEERDAFSKENVVLAKKASDLRSELADIVGTNSTPPLPPGLRGRVVAVDPKFAFVVLNIGEDKGVLKRGEMLVERDGKMLGKVRIERVEANESIANLIPEWTRGEVQEGDQVIY